MEPRIANFHECCGGQKTNAERTENTEIFSNTNSSNRTNFGFREASWKLYLSVKSVKSVVFILNTDSTINVERVACYVLRFAFCVRRGGQERTTDSTDSTDGRGEKNEHE